MQLHAACAAAAFHTTLHSFSCHRLFQMSPQMTALFPKFCDVPQDKLEENEEFRFHAKQVVETVALAVSILDDIPELVCALEDLGRVHSHLKVEGHHFKVRVFAAARLAEIYFLVLLSSARQAVGEALVWTMQQGLGDKLTSSTQEAWINFYGIVTDRMYVGLRDARALANQAEAEDQDESATGEACACSTSESAQTISSDDD